MAGLPWGLRRRPVGRGGAGRGQRPRPPPLGLRRCRRRRSVQTRLGCLLNQGREGDTMSGRRGDHDAADFHHDRAPAPRAICIARRWWRPPPTAQEPLKSCGGAGVRLPAPPPPAERRPPSAVHRPPPATLRLLPTAHCLLPLRPPPAAHRPPPAAPPPPLDGRRQQAGRSARDGRPVGGRMPSAATPSGLSTAIRGNRQPHRRPACRVAEKVARA